MKQGGLIRTGDVTYLPVVSAYARTSGLVEEIDRLWGSKEGGSHGKLVLALILDALSVRTPLFRLPRSAVAVVRLPEAEVFKKTILELHAAIKREAISIELVLFPHDGIWFA